MYFEFLKRKSMKHPTNMFIFSKRKYSSLPNFVDKSEEVEEFMVEKLRFLVRFSLHPPSPLLQLLLQWQLLCAHGAGNIENRLSL